MRVRAMGKTVVFITNAPRPGDSVIRQIDHLKVPHEAYDGIVSSGDVTRDVIMQRKRPVFVPYRPAARSADLRRPAREIRAARERRLRRLFGTR